MKSLLACNFEISENFVSFETEDKETLIDVRFYNNEAEDLIEILFSSIDEFEVSANYFEVLLKVRESIHKEKSEE